MRSIVAFAVGLALAAILLAPAAATSGGDGGAGRLEDRRPGGLRRDRRGRPHRRRMGGALRAPRPTAARTRARRHEPRIERGDQPRRALRASLGPDDARRGEGGGHRAYRDRRSGPQRRRRPAPGGWLRGHEVRRGRPSGVRAQPRRRRGARPQASGARRRPLSVRSRWRMRFPAARTSSRPS